MSNLELNEGMNWKILFTAHDADGAPINLTSGSDVVFQINDVNGPLITKSVGDGVTILSPATAGIAEIQVLKSEYEMSGINMVVGSLYAYAVKTIVAGVESYQAEGQIIILPTLFSSNFDPLYIQFKSRFSEFLEDSSESEMRLALEDAKRVVAANTVLKTADRPIATLYLAAHLLFVAKSAQRQYESTQAGVQTTGAIQSIKVEDRTITYAAGGSSSSSSSSSGPSKGALAATVYGELYLSLLKGAGGSFVFLERA